jgi:hypothetical protein
MPFPPVFTNVWDITFPADTQAANLLGQDLRNFRTDVMQRLSLLSGTLANRPTPETVNATWGGANFGLIYLATDTSQIFQWNGAVWVDITYNIRGPLLADSTAHVQTGTTTEDTIYTANVPANYLGTNGAIKGIFEVSPTVNGGAGPTLRIRFGGTLLFTTFIPNGYTGAISFGFTLGNRGATNSQVLSATFLFTLPPSPNNNGVSVGTSAIDTTLAQTLTITMQSVAIGDSQTFNQCIVGPA